MARAQTKKGKAAKSKKSANATSPDFTQNETVFQALLDISEKATQTFTIWKLDKYVNDKFVESGNDDGGIIKDHQTSARQVLKNFLNEQQVVNTKARKKTNLNGQLKLLRTVFQEPHVDEIDAGLANVSLIEHNSPEKSPEISTDAVETEVDATTMTDVSQSPVYPKKQVKINPVVDVVETTVEQPARSFPVTKKPRIRRQTTNSRGVKKSKKALVDQDDDKLVEKPVETIVRIESTASTPKPVETLNKKRRRKVTDMKRVTELSNIKSPARHSTPKVMNPTPPKKKSRVDEIKSKATRGKSARRRSGNIISKAKARISIGKSIDLECTSHGSPLPSPIQRSRHISKRITRKGRDKVAVEKNKLPKTSEKKGAAKESAKQPADEAAKLPARRTTRQKKV